MTIFAGEYHFADQNKFIICNSTDGPELLIEIYYGPDRGVGLAPGSWIGSLGLIYQSYKHTPLGRQGDVKEEDGQPEKFLIPEEAPADVTSH